MSNMTNDHDRELYRPDEEEWIAIQEGLAQAERGDFVSEEEIAALLTHRDQ